MYIELRKESFVYVPDKFTFLLVRTDILEDEEENTEWNLDLWKFKQVINRFENLKTNPVSKTYHEFM